MHKTGLWDVVIVVFILAATLLSVSRFVLPLLDDSVMQYSSYYVDKSVRDTGSVSTVLDMVEAGDYSGVDSVFELDYLALRDSDVDIASFHRLYSTPELVLLFAIQDTNTATTEVVNGLFLQTDYLATSPVLTSPTASLAAVRNLLNTNVVNGSIMYNDAWLRGIQSYGHSTIDWVNLTYPATPNYSRIDLNSDFVASRFDFASAVMNMRYESPWVAEHRFYLAYQFDVSEHTRDALASSAVNYNTAYWNWMSDLEENDGLWVFMDVGSYSAQNYLRLVRWFQTRRLLPAVVSVYG